MKKSLMTSATALSTLSMALGGLMIGGMIIGGGALTPALAGDMAHKYEITVTNTMETEPIAPVLVTGTDSDAHIFSGSYVTPEAEAHVLTGDPAKLVTRIGEGASVAHGEDGPPGVLLAPGKSLTFTIETAAPEIRIFAMVAPTMKPDNYLTATIKLAPPMDDKMADKGMAKDAEMKDDMMKDSMAKDSMDKMADDKMSDGAVMVPAGGQLMLGDSGERVMTLRKRLGLDAMGAGANQFDAEVKQAVMDFQSGAGLTADGIVGPKTLKALNTAMDDTMMKDTMAKDSMDKMADDKMAADKMAADKMESDAMMKDTMAKDSMDKGDAMMKDSMAKGDAMMKDGMITATLQRFDIGHDEKTMEIMAVEGSFGTVTVKPLQGDS